MALYLNFICYYDGNRKQETKNRKAATEKQQQKRSGRKADKKSRCKTYKRLDNKHQSKTTKGNSTFMNLLIYTDSFSIKGLRKIIACTPLSTALLIVLMLVLIIYSGLANSNDKQQDHSFDDLFPDVLPTHSNTSPNKYNQPLNNETAAKESFKGTSKKTLPVLQKQSYQGEQTAVYWRYQLTGNALIPKDTLDAMVKPYLHQPITSQHQAQLQNQLTRYYIQRGFINSGVLVSADSGTLQLTPINGRINNIAINNKGRLKDSLIKQKLAPSTKDMLNINVLEKQLYLLNKNRLIESIDAKLLPGEQLGESTLAIDVEEARPYGLSIDLNNYGSEESTGANAFSLGFKHYNVLGYGDSAALFYQQNRDYSAYNGAASYSGHYQWPLHWRDSYIELSSYYSKIRPEVAKAIDLDIEGRGYQWAWTIPFYQQLNSKHHLAIRFERKKTLSLIGAIGNETIFSSRVKLLRVEHVWQRQGLKHASTVRSRFSHSLSANSSDNRPDKDFFTLNVQGQSLRRLPWWDSQLSIKGQWQYTEDTLFGFEQLNLSGIYGVRGYPESNIGVDRGLLGSLEWQLPIYHSSALGYTIKTGPFIDAGYGKNHLEDRYEYLSSLGLAVNIQWKNYGHLWLHGAKPLTRPADTRDKLQDAGIHLGLSLSF